MKAIMPAAIGRPLIPEIRYYSDGYVKFYNRRGEKIYYASLHYRGRGRLSRCSFSTATAAVDYGTRIIDRMRRLVVAQTALVE